jgi:class 3 adenylate cyclase
MPSERAQSKLEMAHVLFMDIVSYSRLPMDGQEHVRARLQQQVRKSAEFTRAFESGNLILLPAGDGMALVFFGDPEAPVRCAVEIARHVRGDPDEVQLRMGIHSGPVYRVADINANAAVAGGGVNTAQRVMDCGDAGHILLSRSVAEILAQLSHWNAAVRDLGDVEVKHGVPLRIFNLYTSDVGNPELPSRMRARRARSLRAEVSHEEKSADDSRGRDAEGAQAKGSHRRSARSQKDDVRLRRLTFGRGTVFAARLAPDGQTVLYSAAWNGEPVGLYVTRPGHPESHSFSSDDLLNANILAVSARGELAVSLQVRIVGFVRTGVLARLPLVGGAPRTLLEDVQCADWTAEDTLVVVRRTGTSSRLEWPIGNLVYEAPFISGMRLSHDGTSVALVRHESALDDAGEIVLVQSDGPKVLSTGWASVQGVGWSPDSSEVWFTASERGAEHPLWAVDLQGRARSLLRLPGRVALFDVSRDGHLLLSHDRLTPGIVAEVGAEARQHDLTWLDGSRARDLSSDGKFVLFDETGEGGGEKYSVYVRPVSRAPAKRLSDGLALALSGDGQYAITASRFREPPLLLVPTGPGAAAELDAGNITKYLSAAWAGSNRVVVCGAGANGRWRLFIQAIDGTPTPISDEGVKGPVAVTPDGRAVVGLDEERRAWLCSFDGSKQQVLPGILPTDMPIQWSPDGNSLYLRPRGGARPLPICRHNLRTGRRTQIRELSVSDPAGVQTIGGAHMTRDARTFVFTFNRTMSELYLVSGLK